VAYIAAVTSPLWGLSWDSPVLLPWSAAVTVLLSVSVYRLLGPSRSYPRTDISFIIPLVIAVNVFTVLLGPVSQWVRTLNILLLILCAMYYPLRFNLSVAGLVLLLEASCVFLGEDSAGAGGVVNLVAYGVWLLAVPVVLGRLFQSEFRKKDRVKSDLKRLREGARILESDQDSAAAIANLSENYMDIARVDAYLEMERSVGELMDTVLATFSATDAVMLMSADSVRYSVRVHRGEGTVDTDAAVESGEGLTGWVIKEKKPIVVQDDARGLGYLKDDTYVRSFLAVPVVDGDALMGVLAVDSTEAESFDDEDKLIMEAFARNTAYLIRNSRRLHATTRHANAISVLHDVSKAITASIELSDIMERLADFSGRILKYDYMTLWFTRKDGTAVLKFVRGYEDRPENSAPVPYDRTFIGYVVENGAVSFGDYEESSERMPFFPLPSLKGKCRSFIGFPLKDNETVQGVVTYGAKKSYAISPYQQHSLEVISRHVSAAISNARLHHAIKRMATTDGLTGLINHRHFQEKADEAFTRASRYPEPVSVLLFDIDHFKNVNDTYGHPVGDAVLKRVAELLREAVRDVDIPARYGGEEFTVLMPNTVEAGAFKMAERIRKTIEKTRFVFENQEVPVTISVGTASYPTDGTDKKTVIGNSDQALYHSKRSGRNRCTAYSAMPGGGNSN